MNTSTAITLNDRFSMIKKQPSNTSIPDQRGRSRSRSRNRPQPQSPDLRGSRRNQNLLNKLERQHKLRMALKLKNKSLMASRGRNQTINTRNRMRRAGVIKKAINTQRLRRSNSLTTFIPLNDAPSRLRQNRSRSRSRSRSRNRVQMQNQQNTSVHDRLGGVVRNPRRRMRRGGQQANGNGIQRARSRSRQRLNRNNFRNNTATPTRRSNSVNARLGNNRQNQVHQQQQQQNPIRRRRNFRSRSRNNNLRNNNNNNGNNANTIVRNNNRNRIQMNRPLTGRIIKRRINRKTGLNTQRIQNTAARNIKKLQRGNNNINNNGQARNGQARNGQALRGRARNRGQRINNRGGQQQQQQQQQRRGRSKTRRANRGRGQISKEQLDKQLDDYMAKGSG